MEFVLPIPKLLTYLGFGMIVLGLLIFFGFIKSRRSELNRKIGAIICIIFGILLFLQKNSGKITIKDNSLTLKALYLKSKTVAVEDVQKIWIQDLRDSEWRPVKKRGGTSLEGIASGSFRLLNGRSAFVVLDGNKALCIETKNGELLLFGIEDFENLLNAVETHLPLLQIQR